MESSFENKNAVEVSQVERKYECPICLTYLKSPVLTKCGHHFCSDCIQSWLNKDNCCCPIDGQKLTSQDLFPDLSRMREILDYKMVCPVCHIQLNPVDLEYHQMKEHSEYSVQSDCPFKNVGCSTNISEENMAEHLATQFHHHLSLINNAFLKSKDESAQHRATTSAIQQESQFWEPNTKNKEGAREEPESWKPLVKSLYERIVVLEQKSYEQEARIKGLSTELNNVNSRLEENNLKFACGNHLWILNNFTKKLTAMQDNRNNMFYSPGFYTSPLGYKMCARLNMSPNEDNQLSLLIHMMKTPHDMALDWPFIGRITLAIIHPTSPELTVKETMMSKPELHAFQKPSLELNTTAFGFPEFISIQEILNKKFLQNDSLYIKITAHCV